ncbi:MAG TPA: MFS transporter [Vicinamibacterales bacterium]|nr:MFS transporter [Vicinamibacterales bacterium]
MIARALARVGLTTPEQRAWAWYDWANSTYFTTVITAVFPPFYGSYASADLEPAQATARFGLITTLSMAIVALSAPVLGAIADYTGIKKKLLIGFMILGASSCAAMAAIGRGEWQLASILFVVGNIGVSGSTVFYDSLLPHVARPEETDRVSSAGYALGYLGGGLLLLVNLAWILKPEMFGFADAAAATKAAFVSVAIWWAVFSLPLFRKVPEPPVHLDAAERPGAGIVRAAFSRLGHTFRDMRRYKHAFLLFVAMLLYQDGIQTIIRMASIYGAEIGIDQTAQIAAFVMVQFVGIPFSFLFGALGSRIGTKRALFVALAVYTCISILGYFMTTVAQFFMLAGLVATVQGGSQALSRALFSRMIPANKTSEFFGFYAVAERFATMLGPLVFTLSVALTGSSRTAVLFIITFFAAGALLLGRVDEAEGSRAAAADAENYFERDRA